MQFNDSKPLTFGMELEFQIVSDQTGHLSPSSIQLYDSVKNTADADRYALEATLSTMEINTSVHESADEMLGETEKLTRTLCDLAKDNGLLIRGGGTQLTQFWNERITTPTPRANELDKRFGFLPKRFSTYGMHVHIGAPSGDAALVMGNVLQALVPLFISMSAASPFLQMADTGYCACRPLEPLIYPNGGPMPYLRNWKELEKAVQEIFDTGLGNTLKDIYWDVRPKPEYGTIEVRVFDTPLSVHKAVAMAAFVRACAHLALEGQLYLPNLLASHTVSSVSRFMACRDGLDADLYDALDQEWKPARRWMQELARKIEQCPIEKTDLPHIQRLLKHCTKMQDSQTMRNIRQATKLMYPTDLQNGIASYSRQLSKMLLLPI